MPAINPGVVVNTLTPDTADADKYDQNPSDAVDSFTNDPSAT